MTQANERIIAVASVLAIAVLVFLVDPPWVRFLLVLVPALVLAQRVLRRASPPGDDSAEDRRSDTTVREQIQELLELIRDFYKTCHMVAVGQLEPSKAKAKARAAEERLSEMMARMIERVEGAEDEVG